MKFSHCSDTLQATSSISLKIPLAIIVVFVLIAAAVFYSFVSSPIDIVFDLEVTATPQTGTAPLTVHFISLIWGKGAPHYRWDFDDDGKIDDSGTIGENTHTYTEPGSYNAYLYANYGDDIKLEDSVLIIVNSPPNDSPTADFTGSIDGFSVSFTSSSTDPDGDTLTCSWDFGDSGSSTSCNPTHIYSSPGTYVVTLTVDDGIDQDSESKTVTINPQKADYVVINEIEPNPSGSDFGNEWIELYNPTNQTADISGWSFTSTKDFTKTKYAPPGTTISANSLFIISFSTQFIDNDGDSIILKDASGNTIDQTPIIDDEDDTDNSWQRIDDGVDTDNDSDWTFKTSTKGLDNTS